MYVYITSAFQILFKMFSYCLNNSITKNYNFNRDKCNYLRFYLKLIDIRELKNNIKFMFQGILIFSVYNDISERDVCFCS